MIARELRNATDRYIDLNDIKDSIEKQDYWLTNYYGLSRKEA